MAAIRILHASIYSLNDVYKALSDWDIGYYSICRSSDSTYISPTWSMRLRNRVKKSKIYFSAHK